MWQAIVQGETNISSDIHFQILKPVVKKNCIRYKVRHQFSGTRSGNLINGASFNIFKQDNVVGIRLRSSEADSKFGLQYSNATTTGDEVDVYYWQSSAPRKSFSRCSNTKLLHGITPMVSWEFCS